MLVLGVRTLSRLTAIPKNRVRRAMGTPESPGRLLTVATDRLRGRSCRYIVVSGDVETPSGVRDGADALDAWLATERDRLDISETEIPRTNGGHRWFYTADIRSAAEQGEIVMKRDTILDLGRWLRWAARWMPEGERAAILGEQAHLTEQARLDDAPQLIET